MQKLDCEDHLGKQELGVSQLEALVLLEIVEQLATCAQIDDEAVVVCGDEGVVQLNEEWVFEPFKDLSLCVYLRKLDLILLHAIFLNEFHGK